MLSLALLLACSKPSPPTVVVISSDTTRADAIGAYSELSWRPDLPQAQRPAPRTPHVDALAARGTRFAMALAQAPTTLSSHTAAMSGLDSHGHRVVRNGFPVPDDVPLLAEQLQAAGWDTIAAVGSAALEARQGLARGFRLYLDHSQGAPRSDYMVRGSQVTDTALQAIDQRRPDAPLFLFVHYYDPHMPWVSADPQQRAGFTDPAYDGRITGAPTDIGLLTRMALSKRLPVADARQARGLYLAEVAYVDGQVGRLLDGLKQRELLDHSVVVYMADHGETLDETRSTRPYSHGPDVDLVDIQVPFVWAGSGRFGPAGDDGIPAGQVVQRQVRLMDLAPTVLGLVGLPPIGRAEDLRPLLRGESPPAPPAFAEATQPPTADTPGGWNNRRMERALAQDGLLLVHTPLLSDQRALFQLAPGQPQATDKSGARVLVEQLDAWAAAAPEHRSVQMGEETERALRALGYLDEQ